MGKRKYEAGESKISKKSKNDEQDLKDQPEKESTKIVTIERNDGFDLKHFRKELSIKQGQTIALTQFLQVCLDPDSGRDYMVEYLKSGGNSHEILRQIGTDSKKNLTLATPAFHIFHLIIVKVQSSVPHMIAITEEACRYFLNTFMSTVEIMISENSGPRHRKVILKLLTSMVTLNPDLGIEVLNQAPLTPKHLQYILEKPNYKEKDNVRTAFVHFMTSFLLEGHLPLIKALLEKQGLLALVFPGLVHDEADSVLMFLTLLNKNIISNQLISKSLKLKTFSQQVLQNIFKLSTWKGPPDLNIEDKHDTQVEITNLVSDLLLTLFTSHKFGLYFLDTSLGTSDVNKNQNLYKALLTLKRPWENEIQKNAILEIVWRCPDLHRAVITILEQSFEPQHSITFERAVKFTIELIHKLKPEQMVSKMLYLNPTQVANIVRFTCLPIPLLKHINLSLVMSDYTLNMCSITILVEMLKAVKKYINILDVDNSKRNITELKNRLEIFIPKHLPPPATIVKLVQNILEGGVNTDSTSKKDDYVLQKPEITDSLILLIDLLLLYHEMHPAFFEELEESLDINQLLNFTSELSTENVSILKFKIISLWLTMDSSAISLNNPMFKELFLIILEVYTSDNNNLWLEVKDVVYKFFKNTSIFEADEEEIHIMLYALRNVNIDPISLVADIVEYVLKNIDELTEFVRNQMVHFEIMDENAEASLNKLFDDLMEDRNTDNIIFLENKIPSTFIVGCIQYIQVHKSVKKSLKHFLSVYIAHLLHSNYCPEMTEVLIGDSKLDVRSYVASWISDPVPISEVMSNKDITIRKIGSAVIEAEHIDLTDIFSYLEVPLTEDYDFLIDEIPLKINSCMILDSSELIMWAKYIIFCLIKLTNMGQLKEIQKIKLLIYTQVIVKTSRKLLMNDVCHTLFGTLFRNPHFLQIYSCTDANKDESKILATNFILDVVEQYRDILPLFYDVNKLLLPYQEKNYNDLINFVIKSKKNKKFNNEHTLRVLKSIGLKDSDDLEILKNIFELEPSMLINENKEPSVALEVICTVLLKYSNKCKELPEQNVKNIMKMYTDILNNSDINPNITDFETALTQYFQSKPHKAQIVTENEFKQFFNTNCNRKSMSILASVILKNNSKLCEVYKDEMQRPEILSQREITLPLGEALILHKQFIEANKDLLTKIWSEYKTNIMKIIEKPNKAGPVYITNYNFIRKLLIECSEIEDCIKIFGKLHKFDTFEMTHINFFHTLFLRMLLFDNEPKIEYFINYLMAMLHLISNLIKDSADDSVLNTVVSHAYNVVKIYETIDSKQKDFNKLTESALWQNFYKSVLRTALKVRTAMDSMNMPAPNLLNLMTSMIKLVYPVEHNDISILFDMVTSHSEFLNVMLSYHSSDIKSRLIEFLYTLILKNKSVMKVQHVPLYLSAYHATRSTCDKLLLSLLHYYEENGLPINEYQPYIWGDSAANYYAVRKNKSSSLWGHPTANQVINLFEKDIIERTVNKFPITQKLDYKFKLSSNIDATKESNMQFLLNNHKSHKNGAINGNDEDKLTIILNKANDGIIDTELSYNNLNSIKLKLNSMLKDGLLEPIVMNDNESSLKNISLKAKYAEVMVELGAVDLMNYSHEDDSSDDEEIYDPAFLFPLLGHLLAPGSVASCFKVFRRGLLSIPVMGLGSFCPTMRAAAYHVLHRYSLLLETETRHENDKLLLTSFMETLRNSLSTAILDEDTKNKPFKGFKNPRLPAIGALYLAKGLMVMTAPFDPIYKPFNNFLIAKQQLDFSLVPDFLSLFHDSDVHSIERRLWILDVCKGGTKSMTDVNAIFKSMVLKMIMGFYSSVLSNKRVKEKILEVLTAIVSVPRAAFILIEGYSFLSWLNFIIMFNREEDKSLLRSIVKLLESLLYSLKMRLFVKVVKVNNRFSRNGKMLRGIGDLKFSTEIEDKVKAMLSNLLLHVS